MLSLVLQRVFAEKAHCEHCEGRVLRVSACKRPGGPGTARTLRDLFVVLTPSIQQQPAHSLQRCFCQSSIGHSCSFVSEISPPEQRSYIRFNASPSPRVLTRSHRHFQYNTTVADNEIITKVMPIIRGKIIPTLISLSRLMNTGFMIIHEIITEHRNQ